MKLAGKRAIVTGASSGLGAELAAALAAEGCTLFLTALDLPRLRLVAARVREACPDAPPPVLLACNLTDHDGVRAMIDCAGRRLGGLDILVNNAGGSVYGDTLRTDPDDFRRLLELNFLGPVAAMQAAVPAMSEQGSGLIVNISSLAGIHGVPYLAAYGASKSALATASRSLRAELAGTGVEILVAHPGYTETPIFAREKKVGGARRPAPPYAPPADVAARIVNAMAAGKQELVFTSRGKALSWLTRLLPGAVDRVMARMALRLREEVAGHA